MMVFSLEREMEACLAFSHLDWNASSNSMRSKRRLTHEGQDGQDPDIKFEAQSALGRMVDDARRLFHEAILLAFHSVEMVVGTHVLGHGVVVLNTHDGDECSVSPICFSSSLVCN